MMFLPFQHWLQFCPELEPWELELTNDLGLNQVTDILMGPPTFTIKRSDRIVPEWVGTFFGQLQQLDQLFWAREFHQPFVLWWFLRGLTEDIFIWEDSEILISTNAWWDLNSPRPLRHDPEPWLLCGYLPQTLPHFLKRIKATHENGEMRLKIKY